MARKSEPGRKSAFRIRAGALHGALKDLEKVVAPKATIPILSHVRVMAQNGVLLLTATNLDLWAWRECATDDRNGPGSAEWLESIRPFGVALPGKALMAILGEIDADAMVTIEALEEASATTAGKVTITAGRSRFRLNALPTADFPAVPAVRGDHQLAMKAAALADVFARVEHAISTEETRYYLNGIFVHADGLNLKFAATDGHRLAMLPIDAPDGGASFPPTIIGRVTVGVLDKALAAAVKADEGCDVEISATETGALLRFEMPAADEGQLTLVAKAIDGTFPDYQRVIPADPPIRITAHRATLIGVLKRVAVLADDKSRAIAVEAEGATLRLSAISPELGEASEELACVYGGPAIRWGFDSRYWRDALGAVATDEVRMAVTDEGGPVRIEAVGSDDAAGRLVQVVMPIRV